MMLTTKSKKQSSTILLASALLLCSLPLSAALRSKPGSTKTHSAAHLSHLSATAHSGSHHASHGSVAARSSKPRFHGQQSIDQIRTLEIQQALIRDHYLQGEATGEWDQATRDALTRLQDENHWQTKILPDSRALIKLGLGPSPQNLLNPESAAIATSGHAGLDR